MIFPKQLKKLGIIGINSRNIEFVGAYNDRKYYPLVDDKLETKKIAQANEINVPELYGTIRFQSEVKRNFLNLIEGKKSFVIKPSQGSGGNGILVIKDWEGETFTKVDGSSITLKQVYGHISNTLSGLYSLGGKNDKAMVEQCIDFSHNFKDYSFLGVPDVRVIIFNGFPVMAMMRLATRESDGRANLHQGAVGVGINIANGKAVAAVHHNRTITEHPDTGVDLAKLEVPEWDKILEISAKCYEMTNLGYIGVDIIFDKTYGPMILELNARPGLAIQIANKAGLKNRLDLIKEQDKAIHHKEKIAFSKERFC